MQLGFYFHLFSILLVWQKDTIRLLYLQARFGAIYAFNYSWTLKIKRYHIKLCIPFVLLQFRSLSDAAGVRSGAGKRLRVYSGFW
jgi:hypothetical protein